MSSRTCTPGTVSQTTGGHYQTFTNKDYVKNTNDKKYAQTELIHGKSQPLNRPSTITVKKFNCNLPTGSRITKVEVFYKHSKVAYNNKTCNIPAPTISLMNGNFVLKYSNGKAMSKKGKAPTTTAKKESVTFKSTFNNTIINSNDFGVKIDYPTNTNNNSGYLRLYQVYVVVTYVAPNFSVKIKNSSGNTGYNKEDYSIDVELSNKNNTSAVPTITLTTPAGFTLEETTGGTLTQVQNHVYTWTPSKVYGKSTVTLHARFSTNVTYANNAQVYEGTFSATCSLSSTQKPSSLIAKIREKPSATGVDATTTNDDSKGIITTSDELDEVYFVQVDQEFTVDALLSDSELAYIQENQVVLVAFKDDNFQKYPDNYQYTTGSTDFAGSDLQYKKGNSNNFSNSNGLVFIQSSEVTETNIVCTFKATAEGYYVIQFFTMEDGITLLRRIRIYARIDLSTITRPYFTILKLSDEEIERLGYGVNYVVQSYMKIETSESFIRDWYRNFRIGVFNNAIAENVTETVETNDDDEIVAVYIHDSTDYTNLSNEEIFDNADYWSNHPTQANSFENIECKFTYRSEYPVYIIIAGDFFEQENMAEIEFTEPCIVEESYYEGYEINGTYPVPLSNLVANDGSFSELNINALNSATPLILHQLPLEDDYGSDDETAIRGFEVTGVIQSSTPNITLYARLKSPNGDSRIRSIVLDELDSVLNEDNEFIIGGRTDLWGFSTSDITDLKDWEIELFADNSINNFEGILNIGDLTLNIYVSNIDKQDVTCKVDNEDLAYYGVYLTDYNVPTGLKTDTNFIEIDGTDVNEPIQQNIKEKTISLDFELGDDCNLQESSSMLQEVTKLFVNKRDKYNRPIPKTLELSVFPGIYWEYLLEDVLDNTVEISNYKVKVKLTVPSGTAFRKASTVTNRFGFVNSLINVNPVITIIPSDSLITIEEKESNQVFRMGSPDNIEDKVIVIDCEKRKAFLKSEDSDDETDISYLVDINSDWFSIIEEFDFEGSGCTIKSITYTERW